jgi:hypothetical protein
LWGLTIPPGVLAIADEAIEYRYFLLQRIRSLLAQSGSSLRRINSVGIEGIADIPRASRAHPRDALDPSLPFDDRFCCDAKHGIPTVRLP